jgi:hypothetical protein
MLLYYLEQTQLNLAPGLHFRIQLILLLTKGNHAVPAAVMAASAAALFTFALGLFWRRMAHSRNWAEGDCFDKKKTIQNNFAQVASRSQNTQSAAKEYYVFCIITPLIL